MFDKLRREWHLRDIDARIRRHGWIAMYIGDYEASPTWSYTMGFEGSLGQPEVIAFDLTQADANRLLWWIYKSLERGDLRMVDGEPWAPEGQFIGVWREVHSTQVNTADAWFAAALERRNREGASGPLRAFQLVFRDGGEKLPWEAGYDEHLRSRQPALYRPAEDYGDAPLSPGDREALRLADERGWSIRLIDSPALKWAYTIGLAEAGLPELIAVLPSANGAANMLHEAQEHLERGDLAWRTACAGTPWALSAAGAACTRASTWRSTCSSSRSCATSSA